MSSGQSVLRGAAWLYSAQVITMAAQIVYSAVTTRVVQPLGFGQYAIVLAVTALFGLLAGAGVAQHIGRMQNLDGGGFTAVTVYALSSGLVWSIVLLATSGFWASLWGDDSAAPLVAAASILVFLGPVSLVASGWARRAGRFRTIAAASVGGSLLGMVLGGVAVLLTYQTSALLVSPIVSMSTLCAVALIPAFTLFRPRALSISEIRLVIGYNWRMIAVSIISYANGNIGKLATSRVLGAPVLGIWNRADVLSTVPFYSAQSAVVQALSPEFRHDISGTKRARALWPDILVLTAWVFLCAAAGACVFLPRLVPVVFGPGWGAVGAILPALIIVAAIQAVAATLNSAIETLGKFRWLTLSAVAQLFVYCLAALMVVIQRQFIWILVGLIVALILQHGIQLWTSSRAGYLSARRVLAGYAAASLFALGLYLVLEAAIRLVTDIATGGSIVGGILLIIACVTSIFLMRRHLPPYKILQTLGVLRSDD